MLERRHFIGRCAAGGTALLTGAGLMAPASAAAEGPHGLNAATFRALIDQPFRCFTGRGFAERLTLVEVHDGPQVPGLEQFGLVLAQRRVGGSAPLPAGIYHAYHRQTGRVQMYLAPSASVEGRYATHFGLFS